MKNNLLFKPAYKSSTRTISVLLMFFSLNSWAAKESCFSLDCAALQSIAFLEERAREAEEAATYFEELSEEYSRQISEYIIAEDCLMGVIFPNECLEQQRDISIPEIFRGKRAARNRAREADDAAERLRQKAAEDRQQAENLEQMIREDEQAEGLILDDDSARSDLDSENTLDNAQVYGTALIDPSAVSDFYLGGTKLCRS